MYTNPEDTKRWFQARYLRVQAEIQAYKLEKGCADCGYNEHHAGLEFDHRPDEVKSFVVASGAGRGHNAVFKEIAKCDVVCSRCHSIRTWNRAHAPENKSLSFNG